MGGIARRAGMGNTVEKVGEVSMDNASKSPVIQVRGLRKEYRLADDTVVALKRIDLDIMAGEVCCIFGTSGSGKSTLLNQLAGLEKPTRGCVYIAGAPDYASVGEEATVTISYDNKGKSAVSNMAVSISSEGIHTEMPVQNVGNLEPGQPGTVQPGTTDNASTRANDPSGASSHMRP